MLSEVRARAPRETSSVRVAEVLTDMGLLDDDTTAPARVWIEHRSAQLPAGFSPDIRAWLLVLLEGSARTKPRSAAAVYGYFGSVRPLLESWATTRSHLREITAADVTTALVPMQGWARDDTITALRSLFRFAIRNGIIFTNPTVQLKSHAERRNALPLTDTTIRATEQQVVTPAQRLAVALAATHAASAQNIRHLTLEDVDLPNRRITIGGHTQPLGVMSHRALQLWYEQRRAIWPRTPKSACALNPEQCPEHRSRQQELHHRLPPPTGREPPPHPP